MVQRQGSLTAWVLWNLGKVTLLIGFILACQKVGGWISGLFWWFFPV